MKKKNVALLFALALNALCLSSCQGTPFSDEDFTSKIFPNGYWDFAIQLAAFIILILIVFFIGYKPLRKMLQKRKDYVQGMIDEAKENQAKAKIAADTVDETIENGKIEASRIIADAKLQAQVQANQIIADAKAEAANRLKRAEADIEEAKKASLEETRQQIVDVAMLASTQLLGREVNEDDNARFLKDFVDDVTGEE